jgi:uncharacterized protein DUF1579
MKSTTFGPAALLCCAALLVSAPAFAESHLDKTKDTKATTTTTTTPTNDAATHEAMMAEMAKYSMPGKEHATLKSMEGKWKATVKMWTGPGEPTVTEGTMDNEMEFGGRVLEGTYKGEMMGSKFHGLSLMGFDNRKQEYWSFWTDDMNTSAMMMTGTATADGKTITMKGMMEGPDGKPTEHVMTTKIMGPDTHVFTMAANMGGKMTPMMEITYNRSGAAGTALGENK